MKIEVANSEIYDKVSILQVKKNRGLDVTKELNLLENILKEILEVYPETEHLYNILVTLNNEMWDIEDNKRKHEMIGDFNNHFTTNARLIYLINDERAKIKKYIDLLTESDISEVKSHKGL